MDFTTLNYLKNGSDIQQKAYTAIKQNQVFQVLKDYSPILTGTIPIDINIAESDLDIICKVSDFAHFKKVTTHFFSTYNNFNITEKHINSMPTCLVRFKKSGFSFEIFAQNTPTKQQMAYRHMVIEYKILQANNAVFKKNIIELKQKGIKTEPAFAQLLNITGNPYLELLNFEI